jgi:DNA-binding MarR family transcriptional regulator
MAEEDPQPIDEVSKLLFLAFYDLQRTVTEDWQGLELTMAQLKVLLTLSFKGPAAISKLAEALSISHPTASHLVDRLAQAGIAERVDHATDRRSSLARLTDAGQALAQRLWQGRMEHLHKCLAQLSEPELDALLQGLRALNRAVATLGTAPATEPNPPEDHAPG